MTDDEQRFKNLLLFKMYATDKEVEQISPIIALIIIVGGLGLFIYCKFFQ
jgi:hypothetical protein